MQDAARIAQGGVGGRGRGGIGIDAEIDGGAGGDRDCTGGGFQRNGTALAGGVEAPAFHGERGAGLECEVARCVEIDCTAGVSVGIDGAGHIDGPGIGGEVRLNAAAAATPSTVTSPVRTRKVWDCVNPEVARSASMDFKLGKAPHIEAEVAARAALAGLRLEHAFESYVTIGHTDGERPGIAATG